MIRNHGLRLSVVLLLASGSAQGAELPAMGDYAYGFPIETQEQADYYEIELPLTLYSSVADPRLRDLGVYDGNGRPCRGSSSLRLRRTASRRSALPSKPSLSAEARLTVRKRSWCFSNRLAKALGWRSSRAPRRCPKPMRGRAPTFWTYAKKSGR